MILRRAFQRNKNGSIAVEFALIAPVFMLFVFGIIVFGTIIATYQTIQQVGGEAARAAVAGMSDTERDQLARSYISATISAYPFIQSNHLTIATSALNTPARFRVSLSYDMSSLFAFTLGGIIPLPPVVLTRSATVLVTGS